MQPTEAARTGLARLEQLPNIGRSIAADLRAIGVQQPRQLLDHAPLALYRHLATTMGKRHDPCVLYTLLAARYYLETGLAVPWWKFTEQGKRLLAG